MTAARPPGAGLDAGQEPAATLSALGIADEILNCLGDRVSRFRLARIGAGDTLYRQGENTEALYVVGDGRVKLLRYAQNGSARIVRLHKRGSILGLNGLMDEIHDHTAIAIDDLDYYKLPIGLLRGDGDIRDESYYRLLEYSHEYLKQADTWITEFSTGAIRGRVARLVLYLMTQDESTGSRDVSLLTVGEMAEIIGATPESVSRTLADFKRNKILVPPNDESRQILRCDVDALEREAET